MCTRLHTSLHESNTATSRKQHSNNFQLTNTLQIGQFCAKYWDEQTTATVSEISRAQRRQCCQHRADFKSLHHHKNLPHNNKRACAHIYAQATHFGIGLVLYPPWPYAKAADSAAFKSRIVP